MINVPGPSFQYSVGSGSRALLNSSPLRSAFQLWAGNPCVLDLLIVMSSCRDLSEYFSGSWASARVPNVSSDADVGTESCSRPMLMQWSGMRERPSNHDSPVEVEHHNGGPIRL